MNLAPELWVIGAITGLTYAVLAAGLVLIYRSTRVINFAHGEIGAFGASIFGQLVVAFGWNYWMAFLVSLAVGGAVGALLELGVVRRLFNAPRLILLVATVGMSQVVLLFRLIVRADVGFERFPAAINQNFEFLGMTVRGVHVIIVMIVPAVVLVLGWFLTRTRYGLAVRGAASNADAARLAGVSVRRVSTTVWAIGGVLSTVTFILINPIRGVVVGLSFDAGLGPGLLLRALAVALVGRMRSLPLALAGGVAFGIAETLLSVNLNDPGAVDFWLFVAVVGLMVVRGTGESGGDEATFSLAPRGKPIPAAVRDIAWVRRLPIIVGVLALIVAALLPVFFTSAGQQFLFAKLVAFALIGLSVTVLTGWAGQLSLGQFAFVGIGAMVTVALVRSGMPFGAAMIYASLAGAVCAVLVGAPALRSQGLFLAVTTLAFAVASGSFLLTHETLTGGSAQVFLPRSNWGPLDLRDQRVYYWLALAIFVLAALAVSRLRRTGAGRSIIAVRENEANAAAMTVPTTAVKLSAFAFSGFLAALGGALLAGANVQFSAEIFTPTESLNVVAMTIIGGIASVPGAVLGALWVVGLPALFGDSIQVQLLTSGVGLLLLLLYLPGGLVSVAQAMRDLLLQWVAKRMPAGAETVRPVVRAIDRPAAPILDRGPAPTEGTDVLVCEDITVEFGGVRALDRVSITARAGETLGLIGSNGAGKSTLMNVVSGFLPPKSGRIGILGHDVTTMSPHRRATLGVGRVFQDARLFGDLTVRETINVALEARERSELIPSLLALPPSRRAEFRKQSLTDELVDFVGLGRYADTFVSDLSTGTRRIAELSCLMAMSPRLILLDEPTAGVAQKETEAFGPLINRVKDELGATLVIIEHDMPLVMALSDRMYCLSAGSLIAEGAPDEVRRNEQVIAAYLGTDERAIERSDTAETTRLRQGTPQTSMAARRRQAEPEHVVLGGAP